MTSPGPSMTAEPASAVLQALLERQRAAFERNPFPPAADRRANLDRLRKAIVARQDEIARAISEDFSGRDRMEVLFSEVLVSVNALAHARKHVARWMQRRDAPVGWPLQPARAFVMPQPLGVVGIISPWNYPLYLTAGPLASALAAGNRVMMKLSEHTPATSELLASIVGGLFDPDQVAVVNGSTEIAQLFSRLSFDHLLFTGSIATGREVMRAAAANLTPVTLELGGKSPALVTANAHIGRAAEDIAYGKWLNAGQTCVAPDYVLVDERRLDAFLAALAAAVRKYWRVPAQYTAIINERQHARLSAYMEEARARGCKVIEPSSLGAEGRRMPPVIVVNPPADLALMREEIFGPVLPVQTFSTLDEAIGRVNAGDRPLALYLFSHSSKEADEVLRRTSSGGVSINETLLHIVVDDLPFGGVGASGMGAYHGEAGFNTFSKLKPVFAREWIGLGRLTRPPYGPMHEWLRRILIR